MMLGFLIYFVSSFYGSLVSVVLSFTIAGLTNFLVLNTYGGDITLVGASGAVYYLWGFWMVLYMFIQRHYSIIGRSLRMGAVFLILLVPTEYQPSTSYLAHYVGYGLGFLTGGVYYLVNRDRLHKAEVWNIKEVSEKLTGLDLIALNYPNESDNQDL
jgi:rhomboid protease GluP